MPRINWGVKAWPLGCNDFRPCMMAAAGHNFSTTSRGTLTPPAEPRRLHLGVHQVFDYLAISIRRPFSTIFRTLRSRRSPTLNVDGLGRSQSRSELGIGRSERAPSCKALPTRSSMSRYLRSFVVARRARRFLCLGVNLSVRQRGTINRRSSCQRHPNAKISERCPRKCWREAVGGLPWWSRVVIPFAVPPARGGSSSPARSIQGNLLR